MDHKKKHLNRLANARSPYLLQHATNPVDWYPWGEEAFARAKREDKPIFLSIGYSTCHWCHVMAHESFEDPQVARLLNAAFVCVKVDREERPDIDSIYMTVCQMLTGGGGWPLTIVMTPDKKPFFAATYIPKTTRFGRPGLLELVPAIKEAWETKRSELVKSADRIVEHLRRATNPEGGAELGEASLKEAAERLAMSFDEQHGGFGGAPKFPTPENLFFLLRYWKRTGDEPALRMVEETLQAMRRGGIWDHVGFGFHRYSTDAQWLVPHFEKMLYDQALLAVAHVEAYQATGKAEYERTAREVFAYVLREMTSPEGGFYSAEDADSEGEEGKFYLWTLDELKEALGEDELALAVKAFGVRCEGNFTDAATRRRTGRNILHLVQPLPKLAAGLGLPPDVLAQRLEATRRKLLEARQKRVRPHKDDKVLTNWNGLMIGALAKGARAFDEPKYAHAAARAADFILKHMRRADGRLLHRYRDTHAGILAHADDYAFLAWGLLELYEATFELRHLRAALDLTNELLEHFWDAEDGGLFFTPDDGERLLVRQKEFYDGATPSANSVAMLVLLRLARITGDTAFEEKASAIARAASAMVAEAPQAYAQLLVALDFAIGPTYEVVVAGERGADDTRAMLKVLRSSFMPNKVVLLRTSGDEGGELARIAEFTKDQKSLGGKATAYVCRGQSCLAPVTRAEELRALLEPAQRVPLAPGLGGGKRVEP